MIMTDALRDSLVVMRRDYWAIVRSKAFIALLLAPLVILMGIIAIGALTQSGSSYLDDTNQVFINAEKQELDKVRSDPIVKQYEDTPVYEEAGDVSADERIAQALKEDQSAFVVTDRKVIVQLKSGDNILDKVRMAEQLFNYERVERPREIELKMPRVRGAVEELRNRAMQLMMLLVYIVTSFLSLQSIGMLSEERTNRIVEILVSSTTVPRVFFGKMLAQSLVAATFLVAWLVVTAVPVAVMAYAAGIDGILNVAGHVRPKIGWGLFLVLIGMQAWLTIAIWNVITMTLGACMRSPRFVGLMSAPANLVQTLAMAVGMASIGSTAFQNTLFFVPFTTIFTQITRGFENEGIAVHFAGFGYLALVLLGVLMLGSRIFSIVSIDGWQKAR